MKTKESNKNEKIIAKYDESYYKYGTPKITNREYDFLKDDNDTESYYRIYRLDDSDIIDEGHKLTIANCIDDISEKLNISRTEAEQLDVLIQPQFDGLPATIKINEELKIESAISVVNINVIELIRSIFYVPKFLIPLIKENGGIILDVIITLPLDSTKDITDGNLDGIRYTSERELLYKLTQSTQYINQLYLDLILLRYRFTNSSSTFIPNSLYLYSHLTTKLNDVESMRKFISSVRGYKFNGLVISIIDKRIRNHLDISDIIYKFIEVTDISVIRDIDFVYNSKNKFYPLLSIDVITLKDKVIDKVRLFNYKELTSLNLNIGDEIKIKYIFSPKVEQYKKTNKENLDLDTYRCKYCNSYYQVDRGELVCPNVKCSSKTIGKIVYYINKIGIPLSTNNVIELFDSGAIASIKDLYNLQKREILVLDGMDDKKATMVLEEIENSKNVSTNIFLDAILDGFGAKKLAPITAECSINEILEMALIHNVAFFTVFKGFREKLARNLVYQVNKNKDLIYEILTVVNPTMSYLETGGKNNYKIFLYKLDVSDIPGLFTLLEDTGGVITKRITKDTDIFCTPVADYQMNDIDKMEKAEKYNIQIVDMDNIINYINENYIRRKLL